MLSLKQARQSLKTVMLMHRTELVLVASTCEAAVRRHVSQKVGLRRLRAEHLSADRFQVFFYFGRRKMTVVGSMLIGWEASDM